MTEAPVLVVAEDLSTYRQAAAALAPLSGEGVGPLHHLRDASGLDRHLERNACALILFDLGEEAVPAVECLGNITAHHPQLAVVAISAADEAATAMSCIHQGAYDYLVKPLSPLPTAITVRRALGLQRARQAPTGTLPEPADGFPGFITTDPAMRAAQAYVRTVARTGQSLLILGETGTGKDMLAQAAHRLSGRRGEFVAVNVAGMDDTMISDTLFGHRPGAFTGANGARSGLVLRASAGTLFLDEIGDLSAVSQVKLLRLLQDGEYYPLGSDLPKRSTARIVTATSANLRELMAAGVFRTDLYFRLRAHLVELPSLRHRRGDCPGLVHLFVATMAAELDMPVPAIPPALWPLIAEHPFPGNVRELQALVFDAVARTGSGQPLCLEPFAQARTEDFARRAGAGLVFPDELPTFREVQEMLVAEAMLRSRGNQAHAAAHLGITRQALNKRLKSSRR